MPRSLPLLAALLWCGACGSREPGRNLLIVCVDTLRADELGAYGQTPSRTPALDRLAAESVVFERAHASASWTLPSVGSLFTSLFPSSTGLWTFESRLADSVTTLAERFRDAGYLTHGIASHIFFDGKYGLQQGFQTFDEELCHRKGEPGWRPVTAPEVSARAVRWLDAREAADGRPWLLFVHFFDPHLDYLDHEAPSLDDTSRPERQRYRSEIAFTDRHVGALLEALERDGLAANTDVLFFSDHGESFLEHPPILRHSYSLYEEELRVPLFLRVPGVAPARVAAFVRTVDLLPTLLELHGLPSPKAGECEGISLAPLLAGAGADAPRPPQLAEIRLKDGFHANALLDGSLKLLEDVSKGRLALYDLATDPGERNDLAGQQPERVRELEAALRTLVRAAEEKGARLGAASAVSHTPEELEEIRRLGYAGEDEPPR